MPVVSVITVVKDDPAGLESTISSISRQTGIDNSEIELIVIDSSSPTLESLTADSGIENLTYLWQRPRGIYSAMNIGVSHAEGEYLFFLNAGDTLADEKVFSQLIPCLTKDSPVWLFGRVIFTSVRGELLIEPQWSYTEERKRYFARGVFPSHQGTIIRRDIVTSLGGFDETYRITSDYHLMLKVSELARPIEVSFPIARFQQGGISTENWREAISEFHRARVSVFNPHGKARFKEWADTAWGFTKVSLVRLSGRLKRA